MRLGIRVQDVLDPKILRQKIEVALAEKNLWLDEGVRERAVRPRDRRRAVRGLRAAAPPVRHRHVAATSTARCATARRVLFEGAQATLLDLDHGTYPFVTSSNPVASSAATGVGIGPTAHRPRDRRREGVRDARRRGAVPVGDRGRRPGPHARARPRVRNGHRAQPPLRLARPRRAALRGARERHRQARADEARRALALRGASRVHALHVARRRARRRTSPRTRATSTPRSPCTRRWPAGTSRSTAAASVDDLPAAARRYVEFVEQRARRRGDARRHRCRTHERPHARVARVAHARPCRLNAPAGSPTWRRSSSRAAARCSSSSDLIQAPAGPAPSASAPQNSSKPVYSRLDLEQLRLHVGEAAPANRLSISSRVR